VHRSYIPGFEKGESISAYTLSEKAPEFLELYRSPAFLGFLSRLVSARLTRLFSNMKDAFAYFGVRTLLRRGR